VLVTADGEPKLLDFGIAKLLEPEGETVLVTMDNRQRLTPGYASPEQVRGEAITTVSDVYSLGALLHVMLTGHSPHRFVSPSPSPTELLHVVGEQEIARTQYPEISTTSCAPHCAKNRTAATPV
jgi:serine/threonine protein kinase